jgi:BirA family transcriptional regulator, biotin operon repressor / biotin---[acetyl-CoA-carboxylase] ligase
MRGLVGSLSEHALPVLRQLSSDDFLSGAEISRRLNCSRATVHNVIRSAQSVGLVVQAVHGRGYRLSEPVSWLDFERLAVELSPLGIALQSFDQLASTNARMLQWVASDVPCRAPQRALAVAEWQTQGRGRRGRDWHSGLGGGLTFSFLWRSARPAVLLSGLSLAVGAVLVGVLQDMGLSGARVKWPNDIQVAGAKLAGVLIELASDRLASDVLAPSSAVIGIGINVSGAAALTRQVGQPATDVQTHLGRIDRTNLLLALATALNAGLERFESEGFAAFQDAWHGCHAQQGQPVCMHVNAHEQVCGVALGVDAQGALLLETSTGIRAFHSGEVSLREDRP